MLYGGDLKYSKTTLLHAYRVLFNHPVYHEKIEIVCDEPNNMKGLEY